MAKSSRKRETERLFVLRARRMLVRRSMSGPARFRAGTHPIAAFVGDPQASHGADQVDLSAQRKDGSAFPAEISLAHFATRRDVVTAAGAASPTPRAESGSD